MPGKRQHYIPRFLLRRFCIDPADKKSLVFRLDKKSGANRRANPANEAVVGHYYRIVRDDGSVDNLADETLDRIETFSSEIINRLEDPGYVVTSGDVVQLMLFITTLKQRTPQGREALRETDARASELWLEMRLSDRDDYHRVAGNGRPEDEVENERLEYLRELRDGQLGVESTPSREVAMMFLALEHTTETIFEKLGIVCVRPRRGSRAVFVLSDHPVAHFDPTPKAPEAGASFLSSPQTVTFVALDPRFGLLLGQENPQTWATEEISDADVDELNLLTYAWARDAIFGPTQESVTRVRQLAKRSPQAMRQFAYRPPRIWLTESHTGEIQHGARKFTSRFRGKEITREFFVSPAAADEGRETRWPERGGAAQGS